MAAGIVAVLLAGQLEVLVAAGMAQMLFRLKQEGMGLQTVAEEAAALHKPEVHLAEVLVVLGLSLFDILILYLPQHQQRVRLQ